MIRLGDTFADLGKLGIGVVTLAIILVVGFIVMAQGNSQIAEIEGIDLSNKTQYDASYGINSTMTMQNATGEIPGWVPIIIIVFVGLIVIQLVRKFNN